MGGVKRRLRKSISHTVVHGFMNVYVYSEKVAQKVNLKSGKNLV